jgi:peptidoglycan/LPS O-acetylase OafA/YrhL
MTSGIKFAHTYSEGNFSYFSFLKRRITKIYIPYLIIAALYYLYFVFHRHYFDFNWAIFGRHMLLGTIAAPFYFIIVIMQLYILAPLTLGFCKNITPVFGIFLAGIITILSKYLMLSFKYTDRIFLVYFVYWIIGCYLGINFTMNLEKLRRIKLPLVFLGCIFTVLYPVTAYLEFLGIFHSFYTEILKILFAAFASVMWLLIMPKYHHEGADILSPATFYIYLIHCLVIFETECIMQKMNITSTPQRFFIIFFATYIISITLSVLYAHLKSMLFRRRRF